MVISKKNPLNFVDLCKRVTAIFNDGISRDTKSLVEDLQRKNIEFTHDASDEILLEEILLELVRKKVLRFFLIVKSDKITRTYTVLFVRQWT